MKNMKKRSLRRIFAGILGIGILLTGAAPCAAAAADIDHPAKEGLLQAFGVFLDTIVICSCSAMIMLLAPAEAIDGLAGMDLLQAAMEYHLGRFGVMFIALRLLRFGSAVRLLLVIIMVSAYLTGEIAMNVESGNVVFYRSYLQLLPDVTLRNISLILIIFLLSELSFSHGFMRSGTFLEVLLLVIVYIAIDWGVFQNFGVRPDIGTMLSHSGAGGGTVLAFASTFFSKPAGFFGRMKLTGSAALTVVFTKRTKRCASVATRVVLSVAMSKKIPFITGRNSSSAVQKRVLLMASSSPLAGMVIVCEPSSSAGISGYSLPFTPTNE